MKATSQSLAHKVKRAEAQAISLEKEISRWARIQSNSIGRDLEDEGRNHVYRVRKPQPFNDVWLVIIGEILYDLRSALDHLACALVPKPNPRTEFPIFRKKDGPDGFLTKAPAKLPRLQQGKPDAWDIIEQLQPYQGAGRGGDPERDPLWVLHQLNIIDKHRYPLVSTTAPHQTTWQGLRTPGVGLVIPDFAPDSLDFVQDNCVATFRYADPHPEIDLQSEFALDVFFGEVASPDEPVAETLLWLARHVRTRVVAPLDRFL